MSNISFDGDFLHKIRTHRKLTFRDLEEHTGISNSYLSQLETGKIKNPSLDMLVKLSKYFDLPIDVFVCDITFSRIRYKSADK